MFEEILNQFVMHTILDHMNRKAEAATPVVVTHEHVMVPPATPAAATVGRRGRLLQIRKKAALAVAKDSLLGDFLQASL